MKSKTIFGIFVLAILCILMATTFEVSTSIAISVGIAIGAFFSWDFGVNSEVDETDEKEDEEILPDTKETPVVATVECLSDEFFRQNPELNEPYFIPENRKPKDDKPFIAEY